MGSSADRMSAGNPQVAEESLVRRVFRISLFLKAADSIVEIVGGLALYAASDAAIPRLVRALTRPELAHNPQDPIANFLLRAGEQLAIGHRSVAAIYLLTHGVVKLFLIVMVLRNKAWAYPAFMAALVILIAYQSFQLWHAFAPWLAVLTVFDVVVLWLTTHEYRFQRTAWKSG